MKMGKLILAVLCPVIMATGCSMWGHKTEKAMQKDSQQASTQVTQATDVIHRLEADPALSGVLQVARGIFIVPRYGQAALGLGAQAGEGILLVKNGANWSDPVFYNIGGLTAGLQGGAEAGAMAFILNNDKAVNQFLNKNNFQLSADAGLTILDWEKKASSDLSRADMIAWSDVKGLFGGAGIGIRDVKLDQNEVNAFYEQQVNDLGQIFTGAITAPQAKASPLKQALTQPANRFPSSVNDFQDSSQQINNSQPMGY